ncbi:MAG TPA: M67 family metallopeptidase [Candidatus Nitrosotenuis sp.]|nr:M67 family metallopeptidase [Candidatus Nitrosotenuis sp.]
MDKEVKIRSDALAEMLRLARAEPREECCGLLAGRGGIITHVFAATNELRSATEFSIAPAELFRLFRAMREERLDHLGIYHSHPHSENVPSSRDLAEAHYPGAAYFILDPRPHASRPVRAFRLLAEANEECAIVED